MAKGVGFSTQEKELDRLSKLKFVAEEIPTSEYHDRISKACQLMKEQNVDVTYLHAGTNLYYFTGMKWGQSERMVGAILTQSGDLHFIAPKFEEGTVKDFMVIKGDIHCWEEHESPFALFIDMISNHIQSVRTVGIDEICPFFVTNGIQLENTTFKFINAKPITAGCRMRKSVNEIAIIQTAMDLTMEVQKSVGAILHEGITSQEICAFTDKAHRVCGAPSGSYFCIALFGVDSSFPHGVKQPKPLAKNDVVLIDTGCQLNGYISDITRTYVFGEATDEVKQIWSYEQEIQQIAMEQTKVGAPCEAIDIAVREGLVKRNLGPDYKLPGTSHRTGHGIGLDIHEWPYFVKYEKTLLASGMTFSIEPMICVPEKFGIRLEDHVYMGDSEGIWFTKPSESIQNPFNY